MQAIVADLSKFSPAGYGTLNGSEVTGLMSDSLIKVTDEDGEVFYQERVISVEATHAKVQVDWDRATTLAEETRATVESDRAAASIANSHARQEMRAPRRLGPLWDLVRSIAGFIGVAVATLFVLGVVLSGAGGSSDERRREAWQECMLSLPPEGDPQYCGRTP